MADEPFEGLHPAPGITHVRWAVEAMTGRNGVARVIPHGFEAYVRIMHQLQDGSWSELAPQYLRRGDDHYTYPFPDAVTLADGDLGTRVADRLVPRLAAVTSTPDACHFGLWRGWGEFNRGAHSTLTSTFGTPTDPQQQRRAEHARQRREEAMYAFLEACAMQSWWGARDMWLFDGPTDAVASIFPAITGADLWRRSPQWWWPHDRAWFLGNEIDYPWSYLGGPSDLIAAVAHDPDVESVIVDIADSW